MDLFVDLSSGKRRLCPKCFQNDVEFRFAGDPRRRIGFALAWCPSCRSGYQWSRVAIPMASPVLTFAESQNLLNSISPINWLSRSDPG